MATWLIAAVLVSVAPEADTAIVETPIVPPREGRELLDACNAALRRWAKPSDAEAAAREFLALYKELTQDATLAVSRRESLRIKVRGRLLALADQIDRQQRPAGPGGAAPATVGAAAGPDVLAQWGQPGGWGQPGFGGMPAGGMGMAGPGPAIGDPLGIGPADNGQQLVDLIRSTISPQSWDVNGGPGSIYYWQPGRAIVVRQTDEVHRQLSDMLEQLHRAGP